MRGMGGCRDAGQCSAGGFSAGLAFGVVALLLRRRSVLFIRLGAGPALPFAAGNLLLTEVLLVVFRRDYVPAVLHGLVMGHYAPPGTVFTVLSEHLEQSGPHALAGHLDEAQGGDLRNLMLGPVASQALDEPSQYEVAVRFKHHVDEVDHDDAADVPEAELPHHLFRCLQVVLGDGFLEVAAAARELARVDVNHGHGFRPVNHQ